MMMIIPTTSSIFGASRRTTVWRVLEKMILNCVNDQGPAETYLEVSNNGNLDCCSSLHCHHDEELRI